MSFNAINPYQTFYDSTGTPRAGGFVTFFVNTTSTKASIYSDEALTVAQTNPYELDAHGRIVGDVKYSGLMTLQITNSDGSDVVTIDNVSTVETSDLLRTDLAASGGSDLVGFIQSGTSALARTVQDKAREIVSTSDFGAVIDGATDDILAIQAAINSVEASSGAVLSAKGTSVISSTAIIPGGVGLYGEGMGSSIIQITAGFTTNEPAIKNKSINVATYTYDDEDISIRDLQVNGNGNTGRATGLIDLVKTRDTVVSGVKVTNCDYFGIADGGNIGLTVSGCVFTALGKATGASPAIWSQSYTVDGTLSLGTSIIGNCRFYDNNRTAIHASSQRMLIDGCYFENNGESTIFMNTNAAYCRITNNYIKRANRTDISAHGIEVGGGGHVIANNIIGDVDGSCIVLTNVNDTIVEGNVLWNYRQDDTYYTPSWGANAIGVTSTSGLISDNITIRGNTVRADAKGVNPFAVYNQTGSSAPTALVISGNNLTDGGSGDKIHYQSSIAERLGANCKISNNQGHESNSGVAASFQAGASTGDFTVTGLPFPPQRIKFICLHTATNEVRRSESACCKDSTAFVEYHAFNTNTDANTGSIVGSNNCVRIVDSAGTSLFQATITSYQGTDGLGFTINKSVASINPVILYEILP